MFGMLGSLLGSVTSGLFGMAGQSSANDAAAQMAGNRYQTSYKDMMKAGLNPAMMFGSGGPAPMAPPQNTMAAPAAAMKDAASSAVQMQVADKTIDQLTEQIAKTNAEAANIKAATPGIKAGSDMSSMEADAIKKMPPAVRIPIYQTGFGADRLKNANTPAGLAGGIMSSARTVRDNVAQEWKDGGPVFNIGSDRDIAVWNTAKRWFQGIHGYRDKPKNTTVIRKQ